MNVLFQGGMKRPITGCYKSNYLLLWAHQKTWVRPSEVQKFLAMDQLMFINEISFLLSPLPAATFLILFGLSITKSNSYSFPISNRPNGFVFLPMRAKLPKRMFSNSFSSKNGFLYLSNSLL